MAEDPIPMRLHCPDCNVLHIDEGEFATKPHHTHACQTCGFVWRPAVVNTVGVRFLPGFKNEPEAAPAKTATEVAMELGMYVRHYVERAPGEVRATILAGVLQMLNTPVLSPTGRGGEEVHSQGAGGGLNTTVPGAVERVEQRRCESCGGELESDGSCKLCDDYTAWNNSQPANTSSQESIEQGGMAEEADGKFAFILSCNRADVPDDATFNYTVEGDALYANFNGRTYHIRDRTATEEFENWNAPAPFNRPGETEQFDAALDHFAPSASDVESRPEAEGTTTTSDGEISNEQNDDLLARAEEPVT